MGVTDWFYRILGSLGLWQREATILVLGRGGYSKTTMLPRSIYELVNGSRSSCPGLSSKGRVCPTFQELSIGNIKFKFFDLGDCQTALRALRDYCFKVDAVVYVLPYFGVLDLEPDRLLHNGFDLTDELKAVFSDEAFANVPLLILEADPGVNWILDSFLMVDVDEANSNVRPVKNFTLYPSSGLRDGCKWLSQHI